MFLINEDIDIVGEAENFGPVWCIRSLCSIRISDKHSASCCQREHSNSDAKEGLEKGESGNNGNCSSQFFEVMDEK